MKARVRGILGALVVWYGALSTGCEQQAQVSLAELASEAAVKPAEAVHGVAGPLLRVESGDATRLIATAKPFLTLLAPEAGRVLEGTPLAGEVTSFAVTVRELELGLDAKTGRGRVDRLAAVVAVGVKGDGKQAESLLKGWVGAVPGLFSVEPVWSCDSAGKVLDCLVVVGKAPVEPEAVKADRQLPADSDVVLSVVVGVPGLLRKLEHWVGAVALWAVLPEEAATWREFGLSWRSKEDRLTIRLSGEESQVLAALRALGEKRGPDVNFPDGASVMGLMQIDKVRDQAEIVRDQWSNKPGISPYVNPVAWLDDSWQSQTLELASGYVGIALAGTLNLEDPMGSLVYFMQPTNPAVLDARLAHIFSDKGFSHEEYSTRSGESIHRVFRKGKKKTERMNWYVKNGTYYFAGKLESVRAIADVLNRPRGLPTGGIAYRTEGADVLRLEVSPRDLVQAMDMREKGMGAGMALTLVKTAAAKWQQKIVIRGLVSEGTEGLEARIVVDGLMGWLGQALRDFEPLLNMASK